MKFLTINGKIQKDSSGKLITVPDDYDNSALKLNGKLLKTGGGLIGSNIIKKTLATPSISLVSGTTIQIDSVDNNATTIAVYADGTKIGEVAKEATTGGDSSSTDPICLTGDMLITLADGSKKRIDEITLDDKVLSYNPETMKLEADQVTYSDSDRVKTDSKYDVWTFYDGTTIKTAHRHRFYNVEHQAMVYMDEWKLGEHTINIEGKEIELVSHEVVEQEVRHFTIFTKNQNYFVNGLLSGNRHTKKMNLPIIKEVINHG